MIVACAEAVASALSSALYAYVVAVGDTCAVEQILPVGVSVVALVERVCIQAGILTHLGIFLSVHHRIFVEHGLETDVCVVAYLGR